MRRRSFTRGQDVTFHTLSPLSRFATSPNGSIKEECIFQIGVQLGCTGLRRKRTRLSITKEAVGKRPSAALPSSLVTAAYFHVRLIPRDFGSLASRHFPSAS
jgi:hypothetical protein